MRVRGERETERGGYDPLDMYVLSLHVHKVTLFT